MFNGDLFVDSESGIMTDHYMVAVIQQLVEFYSDEALNVPGATDSDVFKIRTDLMDWVEFKSDGYII